MALRVYNTLTRQKEDFKTVQPGKVGMYVCGPTVYKPSHVGHMVGPVIFDTVKRYLTYLGYQVTFVVNITDIDDKIIHEAANQKRDWKELAESVTADYLTNLKRLGVTGIDHFPRATDYLDEIQRLIQGLIDKGYAYPAGGDVYFDVTRDDDYGKLCNRDPEQLEAGARIEVSDKKRSPGDFALWKSAKPGEPAWDSPWGKGRPGWHIECSAMSLDLLGEGFDIHGGGDDLIFPHHENERAQAQGAGHPFARYWVYNGMVMVGAEKMAKSLGNFTTLKDAVDAHGPRAMRMAVLQTQYRSPVEIGDGALDDAGEAVARLDALARRARVAGVATDAPFDEDAVAEFTAAMDDDFGTPDAMAVVFNLARATNTAIDEGNLEQAAGGLVTVRELAGALGLELDEGSGSDDAEIDALVEQRDRAREQRNFAEADRIRTELADRGITLEDTPTGTIWHR